MFRNRQQATSNLNNTDTENQNRLKKYPKTRIFLFRRQNDYILYMETSEPKWVNPVLNTIGLTHLGSEASI